MCSNPRLDFAAGAICPTVRGAISGPCSFKTLSLDFNTYLRVTLLTECELTVVALATGVASADWLLDTEVGLLQAASITSAATAGSVRPARRLYCIGEVSQSFESVVVVVGLSRGTPNPLHCHFSIIHEDSEAIANSNQR